MVYQEKFSSLDFAVPAAQALLAGNRNHPTYHVERGCRAPLAVYHVSMENVVRQMHKVARLVDEVQRSAASGSDLPDERGADLLDANDHMLDALVEHIEDCGRIIQSFFPLQEDKAAGQAVSRFKQSIHGYRNHVASIVNFIKHAQGRMRLVVMTTDSVSTLGYYVEGVTRSGGIGPARTIHPNENAAFSFNRDLNFHACNLFLVGRRLATLLTSIAPALHTPGDNAAQDAKLKAMLSLISTMPRIYFPDELLKDQVFISVSDQGVILEFPSERLRPATHGRFTVRSLMLGDGVSKEFSVPYLGQIELKKTFGLLRQRHPFVRLV